MEEAGDGRGQGLLRQEGEKVNPGAATGPAHLQAEGRASQGQRSRLFFSALVLFEYDRVYNIFGGYMSPGSTVLKNTDFRTNLDLGG